MENSILRYGLKRKDTSRLFCVVLGPSAQCCPCEATEQKWSQKPKSTPKEIKLCKFHHSTCLEKTGNFLKECQNRMKNDRVMPIRRSHARVAVGLFLTESWLFWSYFLRYQLQICFPKFTLRLIGKTNYKSTDHLSFQKAT